MSALSNFYTLLNGKRGYNPCLDVDRFKEPDRKINAIDFSWVKKILAELPDDNVHSTLARCLASTRMRPSQLNRIRRSDIDLQHATVFAPAAKGGRSNPIALPKAGVQAFRELIKFADASASTHEVQHQLTHSSLDLIERYAKVTRAGLSRVMSRIA